MVKGKAVLVLDFGNSETRVAVKYGKDSRQRVRERKFDLPNSFARVTEDYRLPDSYDEDSSSIMEMSCSTSNKEYFGNFAHGEVVRVDFEPSNACVRPTAQQSKYDTYNTVLSYGAALLQATRCIMEMTQTPDPNDLDIEWHIVSLLPPGDLSTGAELMEKLLMSAEIKFVQPKFDFSGIKPTSVMTLPEGFCAYIGVIYESYGIYREGYSDIAKGITLIIDIGAGTTDATIVENGQVVDNSKHTISIGGNNVRQSVRAKVKEKYGFKPNENDATQAIVSGILRDGSKKINILDIIDSAKQDVAVRLTNDIRDFFEEIMYNIRRIDNLLVCGGGTLSGTIDKDTLIDMGYKEESLIDRPISEILQEYISELAPNSTLVEMPKKKVKDSSGVETLETISPRMLNIEGASIIADKLV